MFGQTTFLVNVKKEIYMKNELGDKCFADSLKVIKEGRKTILIAEVDGMYIDSSEYKKKKHWLQAIVKRVYDCSIGKLN